METIGSRDDSLHHWVDARRWLLVVPVALLPFLVAFVGLMMVTAILLVLGVPMFVFSYFLAAAGSAYLSVTWSAEMAPNRGWALGRTLAVTYVVIAAAVLVVLLVLDQHPAEAVHENETPELIQMLALGGLGLGALGGWIWPGSRRARP